MIDSPSEMASQLRDLARSTLALTRVRRGRLARLVVSVPNGVPVPLFLDEAHSVLARAGLDGFDLEAVPGDGPLRILVAEFER
ncbi:MAG: hypothetical protein R3E98_21730 [Gemmatimonadota bacterium]